MATTTKTRILLRNDTATNWAGSSLTLMKGEVAIDSTNGLMRMGRDGGSTWANSLPIGVAPEQISSIIQDYSKEYQLTSAGGNVWQLQEKTINGDTWSDVAGSQISVDFSGLDADITYLSSELSTLQETVTDTRSTLNTVSSDYLKATDFNNLSNEIGLSAASASNLVVTQDDIKDLAGAMHFRGAVTPTEGQSDVAAIEAYYTAQGYTKEAGDIVIITTNSKEYVYNGTDWVELGAEDLYATKAEVATVSATLSTDYVGKIADALSTAEAYTDGVSAALSTDYQGKIDNLNNDVQYISGQVSSIADTYATKDYVNGVSAGLSTDYVGKIESLSTELKGDLVTLSGDLTGVINTTSSDAITSANAYTDAAIAALSIDDYATTAYVNEVSGLLSTDYVGKIDAAAASTFTSAVTSANSYTDAAIEALSIDTAYIKHGEVVQSDLSGFFILDCGGATLRTDEPTSI